MQVLISKEGERWVAAGLERDVVGQGSSVRAALASFARCLAAYYPDSMENIPPAPRYVWDKYEDAWPLVAPDTHAVRIVVD